MERGNMSERFIIDCNGIIDTWNSTGKCSDKMSWAELCDTLNHLDELCDDKYENYKYIVTLEKENLLLKRKLFDIQRLLLKTKDYFEDINSIINYKKR